MTIAKNIVLANDDKSVSLQDVIDFLNTKIEEEGKASFPVLWENGPYQTLTVEHVGSKYIKIISQSSTHGHNRSVYCFVDYQGNIYKAATWKAPAKHIRGSVFDKDHGWGKALSPYGAAYLR